MLNYEKISLLTDDELVEYLTDESDMSRGKMNLAYSYFNSKRKDLSRLVVDEIGDDSDCEDFLEALKQSEINEFILTETSSELNSHLRQLMYNGWEPIGFTNGYEGDESIKGLMLRY